MTEKQGFNVHIMLWKGMKTLLLSLGMACVPVIAVQLSDPAIVGMVLEQTGASPAAAVAVTAVVAAVGKMLLNWAAHRDGPK